ncbi:MAG: ATP/GTP-binding protein [Candidatus Asgardarchaeum sp.]
MANNECNNFREDVVLDRIKIFVTGPYSAGKTTVVHKLDPYATSIEKQRPDGTSTTIGFDLGILYLLIEKESKGIILLNREEYKKFPREKLNKYDIYKLLLFGCPGQMHFAPVREILAKGSKGVLFVIDSTSHCQVGFAIAMLEEVKIYLGDYIPMVILANKQDLDGALSAERISEILNVNTVKVIETSAIRNINLREALIELIHLMKIIEENVPHQEQQLIRGSKH